MNLLEEKDHPPDQKREKKEKKAKKKANKKKGKKFKSSLTPKTVTCPHNDSRHDAPSNTVAARSQVELEEENTNVSGIATNWNKSMSGGWSWGAAFAAASRVQPTDLGEQ